MNIEIGAYAGFCSGVELCIKKLNNLLEEHKELYCLGDIVHNKNVVNFFKEKGLIIINDISEVKGNNLVIRAHGEKKETYNIAKNKNIKLYDLTCPKVLNIRNVIKNYLNEDTYIILIAKKDHPEAIGTISFCGTNSCIIEQEEDITNTINILKNYKNILIIAQTTFNEDTFNKYTQIIKNILPSNHNIIIKNTICNATSIRQKEVLRLAKIKDCMIIIGGKNSSNTKKLYEIANSACKNTYLIETKEDLNINEIKKYKEIGIMAGASTPNNIIEEVVDFIKKEGE